MNPVHAAVAQSFGDALLLAGYSLILGNSDESPGVEMCYPRTFLSKEADDIALALPGANRHFLFSLLESGQHLILLDRQLYGLETDCLLLDNVVGTQQAMRHLVEWGHYIDGEHAPFTAANTLADFRRHALGGVAG